MIPRLASSPQISSCILDYLTELERSGFSGDIAKDYASRLSLATDNSIYQLLPQAILFPSSTNDVQLIVTTAQRDEFKTITFTPRGGGTGTNGQSLNNGVVVDLSRHMNKILDINIKEGWVTVEAGVVKDQLNQELKKEGYFFSPELSTSNRATIGGMINTDASGQGSMVYGKTSDHVLSIKAVLVNGHLLETSKKTVDEVTKLAKTSTIYRTVFDYCNKNRQVIIDTFPKLNRFLTGYDLKNVFNEDLTEFDLTRIITGSEGSLAFVTEAKLNIIPLPKYRFLVIIKYDSFQSALMNAPFLVSASALSVETIDSKVLKLAKEDIIWESVSEMICDVKGHELQGINIVEFAGNDYEATKNKQDLLCLSLDKLIITAEAGVIGYQTCQDLTEIEKIYAMRKKAVGLLGNVKGDKKPIPFVEDTCVPPHHLADYILEFRALLDKHKLTYGMFGHVDSGVLHVRPALDLCDLEQEKLVKIISDEVVSLTAKYHGLLWGEHGKGFRSEYSHAFFGDILYNGLRTIKAAFDPDNRLNPGKICAPLGVDEPMLSITSTSRGFYDRQIPNAMKDLFGGATKCNGNGLCFNFDINSPMCPSMKLSRDRVYSPKGRAALIREWLRLMVEVGVTKEEMATLMQKKETMLIDFVKKIKNTWKAKLGEYDFSHEVKKSMLLCLSCKACSTQCPIKIDVPDFKARFMQLYYTRYLRPLNDYLVGNIEFYLPFMGKAPRVFNVMMKIPVSRYVTHKLIGMVDLPQLSVPTFKQQLANHQFANLTLDQLQLLSNDEKSNYLLIVQDPFTAYYDAKVVYDFICLVEKLGFKPVVIPFLPNGKPMHSKGFLPQFFKTAEKTAQMLSKFFKLGIPMVGVDPALVLCYRDEYKNLLSKELTQFEVLLAHEFLKKAVDARPALQVREQNNTEWYLLGHCTEKTQLPASGKEWQQIFSTFGATLNLIQVGCCGMAGTYGHEKNNASSSLQLYQMSWMPALTSHPKAQYLATGYSCRSQVKRFEGVQLKHPIQALLDVISA